MKKKIIENNKQDDDLKLLEEVNNESFNNQFLENTPDIKGRGIFKSVCRHHWLKMYSTLVNYCTNYYKTNT